MAGGQPLRRRDERALSDRQYLHLRRCAAYREGDAAICAVTRTDQMKPHAWFVSGGGAWPRLTVPLFRPLSRVLSRRRRSSVGSSRCGCWWWCHCRWGLQRAERTRPSGSAIIRRVALEVFGNHELPHIHAAVEGTDRRCWGRPKVCDEGVTSGCCLVGNISAGVASNPGGGRSHQ